jgi:D-alanyl-D-alanine carboxypeptidase
MRDTVDPILAERLQKMLDTNFDSKIGVGVSIALIQPDGRIWLGTSGFSHSGVPILPNMLFDIGSIHKNLQSVLILKLTERGILSLDDTIDKWLPVYPNVDGKITVRQLLNNTSGIEDFVAKPDSPWRVGFKNIEHLKVWTFDEVIEKFVGEPSFKAGTSWEYSNTNYQFIRKIIEKATDISQTTLARELLFKPNNLDNVLLDIENSFQNQLPIAHGWFDVDDDGEPEDISEYPLTWMATFLPMLTFMTAEDLAHWGHKLLHEKQILNKKTQQEMLKFHRPTPGEPMMKGYGLGIADFAFLEVESIGHLGSQYGYTAAMVYLPENGVTVSLLGNRGGDPISNEAYIPAFNTVFDTALNYL